MGSKGPSSGDVEYSAYSDDPEIEEAPTSSRLSKAVGALALLIGASFFVNTTLAANISLTNSNPVEFGQGILRTTACSGSTFLSINPTSSFTNAAGGGSYHLASIRVSNIPDSCFGSDFLFNAYGETSSAPIPLFNSTSTDAIVSNNAGTFQLGAGSTGMTIVSGPGQFTISFTVPVALSANISRVTIQSSARGRVSCALGGECVVGDIGPGGGRVFYVLAGGFSCGPTRAATCRHLEIAPTNWNGGNDPQRSWAQSTPINYTTSASYILLSADIGFGALNTKAIIDQGNSNTATSAAALAASYSPVVNGTTVSDWFLPSQSEMAQVWAQRAIIGFSASGPNYWTSTSPGNENGRYFMFDGGTGPGAFSGFVKSTANVHVRPARAF